MWSACQWVINRNLISAGDIFALVNWLRIVGGASIRMVLSIIIHACMRPGGVNALPVPSTSMNGADSSRRAAMPDPRSYYNFKSLMDDGRTVER